MAIRRLLCLCICVCSCLAGGQAFCLEWQQVDAPAGKYCRQMAVAPDGSLYMAAANTLSRWTGSGWQTEEVIPNTGYIDDVDLKFSSDGKPHIVYSRGPSSPDVIYCTKSGNTWVSEYVTQNACGLQTSASLGLDSAGRVYVPVVYGVYGQSEKLHLMTRSEGGVWTQSAIDLGYRAAKTPQIQVADANNIRVAYTTASSNDLKIATYMNGSWTYQVPDSTGVTGWYPSFAVTPTGSALIGYLSATEGRMYLQVQNKYGNLNRYAIDVTAYSLYCAVTCLADGSPVVAYITTDTLMGAPNGLRVAILRNGAMEHYQVVESPVSPQYYTDLTSAVVGNQLFIGCKDPVLGNQVWYATVPEPGSFAGLIAGLVAVMPLVRRSKFRR